MSQLFVPDSAQQCLPELLHNPTDISHVPGSGHLDLPSVKFNSIKSILIGLEDLTVRRKCDLGR